MSSKPIAVTIVDFDTGLPIDDGVAVTFHKYVDRTGAARAQPPIEVTTGGGRSFQPTAADAEVGTIWVFDAPNTSGHLMLGLVYDDFAPFIGILIQGIDSNTGEMNLAPVDPPIWGYYTDTLNVDIALHPTLTKVGGLDYLWYATPADADLVGGVKYKIDTQGALPAFFGSTLKASPRRLDAAFNLGFG